MHNNPTNDFNLYVPKIYDGTRKYVIYFTLPGYQGLYFQGVAENIKTDEFGFEAQKYNNMMIVVAPQLNDWGEISANQTIELVEYFIQNYNIDTSKVYASGMVTMSQWFIVAHLCIWQLENMMNTMEWNQLRKFIKIYTIYI